MRLETFFDNFELLADAPNGVQKLRELILQLAVRGKLVPQDPNDEPAFVLLQKIKAEKERLAKEKKIRKPTALPLVEPNQVPFDVPLNWRWVCLGEIGQIVGGGTPRTEHPEYYADNGVPWLTPADLYGLEEKFIGRGKRDISILGLKKSSAQLMPTGTVLFSSRAPIGYVAIAKNDLSTNQGFKSCVPFIMEMNEYIYYFLKFAAKQINDNASGTTFKEVSGKEVSLILFPVPPLEEQKRIVAKVDQLIAICDKLEERQQKRRERCVRLNNASIDQLLTTREPDDFSKHWQRICDNFDLLYSIPENISKLRQAILQLAVQGKLVPQDPNDESASVLLEKINAEQQWLVKEKKIERSKPLPPIEADEIPFELPNSWKWVRLGKVLVFGPKNGYSPKPVDYVTNVKSLTLSATTSGEFKGHCFKYIDEEIDIDSHLWLEKDDLLIQRGNTIEYVGVAAVYKGLSHEFIYPDLMMKIRLSKYVYVDYLHKAINSNGSRNFLRERATGTSGSMPKINQTTVSNLPIPLPPQEEQNRIVAKVDQLMTLCDELEAKLTQSQINSEELMDASVRQVLTV